VTTGSYKADVSINNLDGVYVIDKINDYLKKMPALRPLVMVIKTFLLQRKLNSAATSGLSSYALICMAISLLQVGTPLSFHL
jgi:non-canonical poly(A) RNA polymerase PAPD5/7